MALTRTTHQASEIGDKSRGTDRKTAKVDLQVIYEGITTTEDGVCKNRFRKGAKSRRLTGMRGESARPGKRPLRALSASEKMDAIQRVHEGESKASVARDIGVPESTLRGWCKSEHKIRGMARNSSTPDSEAHSPASSAGANVAAANLAGGSTNLSSEDEGPCAKKAKIDQQTSVTSASTSFVGDVCTDSDGKPDNKPRIDYVGLMTSMAGMRPENSSLLLQQLGLLSGATGTLAKNLLGMSPALTHGSTVGLVENGLQYTKNTGNACHLGNMSNLTNSNKRHSLSAIAPTQMDSLVAKSCSTRKSLPPAAEAPSTLVPASPRKTHETNSIPRSSSKPRKDGNMSSSGSNNKKVDEALWLWLTQQQQLLGQQSASFNPSINQQDGSWFWQWYKQCSFPLVTPTPTPPAHTLVAKKSPSRTRAMLDNVLSSNNSENVLRNVNMEEESAAVAAAVPAAAAAAAAPAAAAAAPAPTENHEANGEDATNGEEAIRHGEKFLKWLMYKCSEPSVTRLQIIQFKYLLDRLKAHRKKTSSSSKQSRK
ncbi:protein distal antenna isoform X1 [Bombus vancouverensis nearcticus]|uniref:protein distal antenna isoform X1 n=2 Tax=Bombus vancouverensis nearcticus TaxID=2705178 RepID=UPI00402BC962